MRKTNLICLLGLFLFSSCGGMRVATSVQKSYPVLSDDEPVEVYFTKEEVPVDSESLGVTGAFDSGTTATNKCDSVTAVEHLKAEARKIGGNAVFVTDYIKPSFFGSSCHQMAGTVLRVHDFTTTFGDDEEAAEEVNYEKLLTDSSEAKHPKFSLSLNAGYGWRMVSMDGISGPERDFYDDMNEGFAYELSGAYFFRNSNLGVGLTYSGLTTGTGDKYTVKGDARFNHYVVDLIGRNVYLSEKWVPEFKFGLGYADYQIKMKDSSNNLKEWGGTVGLHYSFGVDYILSEQWGIGVTLSGVSGLVSTTHIEENGVRNTYKNDADQRVGLGRLVLSLGLRYFFN